MIWANIQIAEMKFFGSLFFVFKKACPSESILITKEEYNQQITVIWGNEN